MQKCAYLDLIKLILYNLFMDIKKSRWATAWNIKTYRVFSNRNNFFNSFTIVIYII